jgi:methionine--tRNA ligase beta chain
MGTIIRCLDILQEFFVSEPTPAPSIPVVPASKPDLHAPKPEVGYDVFAQLDLRVAVVLEAREHPNANKLLLLKVKVGAAEKQIVAGIKAHYDPRSLVGKKIVIVNNLAPTMLRGEESQGMLLAASDETSVVLVTPERDLPDVHG